MNAVTATITGSVAVITVDNPPVHALSTPVRSGLIAAVRAVEMDPALQGSVIATAGRTFIAGADIGEMDRPLGEPQLPAVIAAITACSKPLVAALHGSVLGGGLEIALACRARLAEPGTSFGFPEVKIGLIPGASGTQRLLRLTNFDTAVRIVTGGKPVTAIEALRLGLIDQIVDGPVLQAAIDLIASGRAANAQVFPTSLALSEREAARPNPETLEALRAEVTKAARGQRAPLAALALMEATASLPFAEGLAEERAAFLQLRASREAKALRRLFLAERNAGRSPELQGVKPLAIGTLGVVGAGLMGCGIAFAALNAGLRVVLAESSSEAMERGRGRMAELFEAAIQSRRLTSARAAELEAALAITTDFALFRGCDAVIEAVFEDLAVKHEVFAKLEAVVRPDCMLATNTSYLDLDAIAAGLKEPSRFLGLHFFSPAHVMRLLEVVRGAKTSPPVLATGVALGRKLGKIPVITGVCEGFCGNRILKAYRIVAETMVEEGAAPEVVDGAMTDFGFPMGPFAVQDMAGIEIAYANRKLKPALAADGRRLGLVELLVEAGRLGRKNGKGWYAYPEGARQGQPDPDVTALIHADAARRDIPQKTFSQATIREALLAAMRAEGRAILDEGIVARAEDIDLVMVHGYGFPAHKGGPMFGTA
ncbi:MAG: enoyl-CoA hydratase/isomerase family protein [Methylocystis sp.]|nr:enoyl-CoA hydratase/isomerase family protein [Methylocystis sp.]MCA3584285.1 enoyl-CoA hydratase/isomerase family protein [Methylocystis sp.]MCA3588317.1 enoyl-CoA hydratase/isomerase family protein [Methylocystis sp.]MCA3590930.1 enoyl-CoA hydratase/isomerase family protein [Methylocystis sp.]